MRASWRAFVICAFLKVVSLTQARLHTWRPDDLAVTCGASPPSTTSPGQLCSALSPPHVRRRLELQGMPVVPAVPATLGCRVRLQAGLAVLQCQWHAGSGTELGSPLSRSRGRRSSPLGLVFFCGTECSTSANAPALAAAAGTSASGSALVRAGRANVVSC